MGYLTEGAALRARKLAIPPRTYAKSVLASDCTQIFISPEAIKKLFGFLDVVA